MRTTKIRPSYTNSDEISFLWTPSERLVELVHIPDDGLQFAIRDANGIRYEKKCDKYSPISWLAAFIQTGGLRLPSCATLNVNVDDLAQKIRACIHKYFDCSPSFESVATLYVLHTWMYDRFQAVPYLRFLGLSGTGKSRGTEVIGALCYRPLVISGSSSPASMYRTIEAVGGTVLLDEADFTNSTIGTDIVKILNAGYQKNSPVIRNQATADGDFIPRMYEVFGPKIISGRRLFKDDATETRCLLYTPQLTDRADIPIQLSFSDFEKDVAEIQNMALGWRLENLDTFGVMQLALPGLKGRAAQIGMPLALVANSMSHGECKRYRQDLSDFLHGLEQQAQADRRDTVEGKLVQAFASWKGEQAPTCKDLVETVLDSDDGNDPGLKNWLTPKRASTYLRGMGFETHHTNHGAEVTIDAKRLGALCQRFGIVHEAAA